MKSSTNLNDGRRLHPNVIIQGRQATAFPPPPGTTSTFGTWGRDEDDNDNEASMRDRSASPPPSPPTSQRRRAVQAQGMAPPPLPPTSQRRRAVQAQGMAPPPPPSPSTSQRRRAVQAQGMGRGGVQQHRHRQRPAQRPYYEGDDTGRGRGQLQAPAAQRGPASSHADSNPAAELVRPVEPLVMMWDGGVKSIAEQLTGYEPNDPACQQTGLVRLVGAVPGDEWNLEELHEAVAQEMGGDPQHLALIDYEKYKRVMIWSAALEHQNRSLKRQVRNAGLEPSG